MGSDNLLSKSIRPLSLLVLLLIEIGIVAASAFGAHVDPIIVGQVGVLLSGAFGFYFNSRKAEKVAAQNTRANIQLEKIRTKHDQKQERRQSRRERRADRREERDQDKLD